MLHGEVTEKEFSLHGAMREVRGSLVFQIANARQRNLAAIEGLPRNPVLSAKE